MSMDAKLEGDRGKQLSMTLPPMHNEPKSALSTWARILGSIIIPSFVFLGSTMSSSVPHSELFLALLALTIMTVIGITLGFCGDLIQIPLNLPFTALPSSACLSVSLFLVGMSWHIKPVHWLFCSRLPSWPSF